MTGTNIVLIGFMGSGKTSVGRLVSKRLGFQFIDLDAVIVDRVGMEISSIFAAAGEDQFRNLETDALESMMHLNRCVFATGGGAVLRERNRVLLKQLGFVVLLRADEGVIFERVSRNSKRPLLQTPNPKETISRLIAARNHLYEETAEFVVDSTALSHAEVAERIVQAARNAFGWQHAA